jgi:hypothetical protein
MTKDDIIKLAQEAGYEDLPTVRLAYQGFDIKRFANLVAEREREECARVCDEMEAGAALSALEKYRTRFIADAIRARSKS